MLFIPPSYDETARQSLLLQREMTLRVRSQRCPSPVERGLGGHRGARPKKPAQERHRQKCADNLGQDESWRIDRPDPRERVGHASREGHGRVGKTGGCGKPIAGDDVGRDRERYDLSAEALAAEDCRK